jgi:hypothetical protein
VILRQRGRVDSERHQPAKFRVYPDGWSARLRDQRPVNLQAEAVTGAVASTEGEADLAAHAQDALFGLTEGGLAERGGLDCESDSA